MSDAQGLDFPDGLGYFAFEGVKRQGWQRQCVVEVTGYINQLNDAYPVPAMKVSHEPAWIPQGFDYWQGKYTRLHMPWETVTTPPATLSPTLSASEVEPGGRFLLYGEIERMLSDAFEKGRKFERGEDEGG